MSLKNSIESELGIPIRLRAGAPGSLKVFLNGEQLYSKKEARHSLTATEIIKLIREKSSD